MRLVTWRSYVVAAVLAVVYAALGFWLSGRGDIETWIYRCGLLAATAAPVLFVALYTWAGLFQGRGKWWTNPFGSALVQAALSLVPITAPLAYVFWFDNGMMTESWLAWLEVSGPVISALAWLRLGYIWLYIYRYLPAEPPMRPHLEVVDDQAD